jgi:hypothetical protein
VFVPGKNGAYPSESPLKCSTPRKVPGLTHKHYTQLERLVRDKHSSLFPTFVNYGYKKFCKVGPRQGSLTEGEGSVHVTSLY